MENSRKKNTSLSIVASGIRQISSILLQFVSRTVFIYILGKEYLGLNGLFTNILQLLALSELGIGTAITFYLYKPLALGDKERVKVLMHFYKKCYNVVGLAILLIGCSIMPFLHKLVNFDQPLPENLYVVYLLFLLQSACTYFFFAYKQSLITADQKLYKVERINIVFLFIGCLVDIIVLLVFRAFLPYLIFKVAIVILKNLCIALMVDKEYPYIKEPCETRLSKNEIRLFFKDVYSVAVFNIGSVFFNSLANFIISVMIGTAMVGVYSNYTMITTQAQAIFMIFITSVTASVGNVLAKESKERQKEIFDKLRIYAFVISGIFSLCIFQLINSFINIWLGNLDKSYLLSQFAVLFISIDFYINTYCQIHNTFRQASGNFRIGQYLQFIGGAANLALAIPMCKAFGIAGVFAAQVISKMVVTNVPFLCMVEQKLFNATILGTMWRILRDMGITILMGITIWFLCKNLHQTTVFNFVFESLIVITIPTLLYYFIFRKTEAFTEIVGIIKSRLTK